MKKFRDFKSQIHTSVNKIDILEKVYDLFDKIDEAREDDSNALEYLIRFASQLVEENFDSTDGIHDELRYRVEAINDPDYLELPRVQYKDIGINEVFRHGGEWFKKIRMKEFVNIHTGRQHFATHDMPDFFVRIDEDDKLGELRFGWINEDLIEAKHAGYTVMRKTKKLGTRGGAYAALADDPVFASKEEAQRAADKANNKLGIDDDDLKWFVFDRGPIHKGKGGVPVKPGAGKPNTRMGYRKEDAPVNAVGVAPGNVAGVSDNDPPVDNRKKKKPSTIIRRKTKVAEEAETFAGCSVFDVDSDTFRNCRLGRVKYSRWNKYLDDSTDVGASIKKYSQRNPNNSVILRDENTKVMMYLQRSS
jgi:hypothetical protein